MLFNSYGFIFLFLPLFLAIARHLPRRLLLSWLVLSSYLFYALVGQAWFLLPMAATTLVDFYLAAAIQRTEGWRRLALLAFSLSLNLGLLALFKYSVLAASLSAGLGLQWRPAAWVLRLAMPAGISFYTFQSISYVVDVYERRCEAETHFLNYAGFIAFFPHLVAGPLTRHSQLTPQLAALKTDGIRPGFERGVFLFSAGLFKKAILGDSLGKAVDHLLGLRAVNWGFGTAWLMLFGFGMQIYFDFSGYSDMAMGVAQMLGIRLPVNFDSPYQSRSLSEFWRRWHMSLSLWMRDYLYYPMGGNHGSGSRRDLRLALLFGLSGLWHGADWNFLLWGLWHASGLILEKRLGFQSGTSRFWRVLSFLFIMMGWVLFRCKDFALAGRWYAALLGLGGMGWTQYFSEQSEFNFLFIACALAAALCAWIPEPWRLQDLPAGKAWVWPLMAGLTAAALMRLGEPATFYYFRF